MSSAPDASMRSVSDLSVVPPLYSSSVFACAAQSTAAAELGGDVGRLRINLQAGEALARALAVADDNADRTG